jgi:hypothetical protein
MIRSIAFVLSTSAARDPIAALATGVVPVEPAVVEDTHGWPPHLEPFRSFVYTSDELERLGARSVSHALRLTPGVVVGPRGRLFIHGTPLGDGSVMVDGVRMLGAPRTFP